MMAENRIPKFPYPHESKRDTSGIDLKSVTGQIKSSLWDLARNSMLSYLSGNEYSEDKLKDFLKTRDIRVPVNLPKDYGVDLDFNRPMPHGGPREDFRITLKKKF